ncbi:Hypothetical protein SMAX5B_003357 [Scophthalmus maximus]|uniref:Uncharacterized protein n=1 Tax=Scophthalmus maximus TaxID=52904 RepID=A0A2U9BI73_SCOMX|nr:Hypothetical protein SMAX5B_003357 [Scophthalmus maximus]
MSLEYLCSDCMSGGMNSSGGANDNGEDAVQVRLNLTSFDHTYASYRVIDLQYERDVALNSTGGESDDSVDAGSRELVWMFRDLTSFDHIYANNQVIDGEYATEEAQSYIDSDSGDSELSFMSDSDSLDSTESYFVASPEGGFLPKQGRHCCPGV